MINYFVIKDKNLLALSLITAVICSLLGANILFGLGLVLLLYFTNLLGKSFLLGLVIISFLTIVSDLGATIRIAVNLFGFTAIAYLFFSKYHFDFSNYKKIPSLILIYLLILLLIMMTASMLSKDFQAGLFVTIKTFIFFMLAYAFYSLISGDREINIYHNSIIIASSILAAYSVYNVLGIGMGLIDINAIILLRFGGLIGNPNGTAAFYAISIPLLIGKILKDRHSNKLINLALIVVLSIGLISTVSRAGMLALGVSLLAIFFFLNRKLFYKTIAIVSLVSFVLLLLPPINEVITTYLRIEEGVGQRDILWALTIEMIKNNIWFGVGPGLYTEEMFNYMPVMLDSWHGTVLKELYGVTQGSNLAHNFYMSFFSEMGILGLLLAILFPILFFFVGFKALTIVRKIDYNKYINVIIALSIGIGMFVRSFFEGINIISFGWITMDLPFWLIFGSLLFYYQNYSSEESIIV